MNELQIFQNERFGTVRTITEECKTLFCAKDVATSLGYKDPTNAVKQHCRGVVKRHLTDSLGRNQMANFIPEGDIYRLAAKSELPGASEFESWIFDEVLPAIRRTGYYGSQERALTIIAESMERLTTCVAAMTNQIGTLTKRMEQLESVTGSRPISKSPVKPSSTAMDSMEIAAILGRGHSQILKSIRRAVKHADADFINPNLCFTLRRRRARNNVQYTYYQVNERGIDLICRSLRDDGLAEKLWEAFEERRNS